MNKTDAIIAAAIGEITAIFFYFFLKSAQNTATGEFVVPEPIYSMLWIMMPLFFFLSPLCLWIAAQIGKKYISVFQLAKFLLVGVMATIFDLGTLSVFMAATKIGEGLWYVLFKSISFVVSAVLKYIPDKYWAFKKRKSAQTKKEFLQFFMVTLLSYALNVGISSAIVSIIGPQFNFDKTTWGVIGGMGGILVAFTFNFIGYKFIVFKK